MKIPEAVEDPQVLANDYIISYQHPASGHTRTVGFPHTLGGTPTTITKPPPELGQHTEEVLLEAGYSWDDITKMKNEGVIS